MQYICRACQKKYSELQIPLTTLKNPLDRLRSGDVLPDGICPECGDFVHEEGRFATSLEISCARAMYQNSDLEIDADAKASHAPDHSWVQAWVYVPHNI